ncbi:MAG: ferrous iron transport protein A [Planctomycetes bacterium]|nr:ferrous iron transport protein A [Planctomycetota bacterium]
MTNLSEISVGQSALITNVSGDASLQQRILEMGILPGQQVRVIRTAPLGDPIEVEVMGYSLSLRKSEAVYIEVE